MAEASSLVTLPSDVRHRTLLMLYTASGAHVNGLTSHMELPPEHAGVPLAMASSAGPPSASRPGALPVYQQSYSVPSSPNPGTLSPASVSSSGSSAAASFFARAAQKLNISSRKKKKAQSEMDLPPFPTNFSEVIRCTPPPAPPGLLRGVGRAQNPGTGKVKVMLRVCPVLELTGHQFLSMDERRKQVTVYDPASCGITTAANRRPGMISAPKMFAFDAVFSQDDALAEICSSSLTEIIQAVVNGADGCLFCYGHARLGKTYTMIGVDDSPQNLGIIPCSIAWLFKLINEQKEKTGARFSVRVSAVEVTGKQEKLKDLLADVAGGQEAGSGTAPGVYLREDPICGTQLENQSELRAPTADRATYYLDAAVAARTIPDAEEDARNSHLLFTLHVYQYRVEKGQAHTGTPGSGVAGGRSRLHLVDLGSCSKSKEGNALSLSALGNVILALLNGQRHVPHRDSKLTQLMRDSLGNLSCRTCMIAHVSPSVQAYNETLQVIQLASRIHRMKRRKTKQISSTSSEESSCDESGRLRSRIRVGVRMGTLREGAIYNSSLSASSDPDYTSSEQSCDTVIYVGPQGQAISDRELTDNEGPPVMVPVPEPSSTKASSSGSKSSGSKSSSGEEVLLPEEMMPSHEHMLLRPSMPRYGASSLPRSPRHKHSKSSSVTPGGVVQLPRKINIKSKHAALAKAKAEDPSAWCGGGQEPGEHWIDGPAAPGEFWVDGPTMAPPGTHEWRDPSSAPATPHRSPKKSSVKSQQRHETWVDGPTAFQVAVPDTKSERKMWSEMSKPPPPPRGQSLKHWKGDGKMPGSPHKTKTHDTAKSSPTHHSSHGHHHSQSPERTYKHSPERSSHKHSSPDRTHNKRSTQELPPHTMSAPNSQPNSRPSSRPNSRPNSIHEGELEQRLPAYGETQPAYSSHTLPGPGAHSQVKSFVRDWVERHSGMAHVEEPVHVSHRRASEGHDPRDRPMSAVLSDVLYGKHGIPDSDRIGSCHSTPRIKKRVKRGSLPTQENAITRCAEWVRSIHDAEEEVETRSEPVSPSEERLRYQEEVQNAPECDQALLADMDDKPPPPYESCILERPQLIQTDNKCNLDTGQGQQQKQWCDNNNKLETSSVHSKDSSVHETNLVNKELSLLDTSHDTQDSLGLSNIEGSVYEDSDEHCESRQPMLPDAAVVAASVQEVRAQIEETGKGMTPVTVDTEVSKDVIDYQSPPSSSSDSDRPGGKKLLRPTCLRRPDGASNPNLSMDPPSKPPCSSPSSLDTQVAATVIKRPHTTNDASLKRAVLGQSKSPDDTSNSAKEILPRTSEKPSKSKHSPAEVTSKPPLLSRPSILPKSSPKKSSNVESSPSKTATPSKSSSKSAQKSGSPAKTNSSPTKSAFGFGKSSKESKASKASKNQKASSPESVTTSCSPKIARSFFSRSSKLPTSKSKNQSSPTKSPSSSKEAKLAAKEAKNAAKEAKSAAKAEAKSKSAKSPSPSKKDSKLPVSKAGNTRVTELSVPPPVLIRADSDSGNDSGIVDNEKGVKLASPYSTVTNPRISSHSSSGHGSDNSSTFSTHPHIAPTSLPPPLKAEVSSGYESMMRDSEATGTSSSNQDSTSESSTGGLGRNKLQKKKTPVGARRSRSAPPCSATEESAPSRTQSPASTTRAVQSPSPQTWVDTRRTLDDLDEPLELEAYDGEDVERLQRRREEDAELRAVEKRRERIQELLEQQEKLKAELLEAKGRLMINRDTWSYDLYVAEQMDCDDQNYLEALEKETQILEKRVEACKSRIMMVTCFDVNMT